MRQESSELRVGFRTNTLSDKRLQYVRQLGVTDVFINPVEPSGGTGGDIFNDESDRTATDRRLPLGPDEVPSVDYLEELKAACAEYGIDLAGVHTLGYNIYGDIKFGRDGKDEQLAAITELIENMGEAGLPVLGYQWNPRGVVPMRTGTTSLRGGAQGTSFDIEDIEDPSEPALDREYDEAELWGNYEAFLEEILPVAEQAGVTLALHPIDPPSLETVGGIPRLFRNPESFRRAMDTVPSDNHGLKLCLGCFSEMGVDVAEIVREFGERDDIVFVHFRDVDGTAESFTETFVDCGNFDELEVMQTLADTGFDGIVIPDHVAQVQDDTDWGHRGRGFTAGYLRGLVTAVNHE